MRRAPIVRDRSSGGLLYSRDIMLIVFGAGMMLSVSVMGIMLWSTRRELKELRRAIRKK